MGAKKAKRAASEQDLYVLICLEPTKTNAFFWKPDFSSAVRRYLKNQGMIIFPLRQQVEALPSSKILLGLSSPNSPRELVRIRNADKSLKEAF